MDTVLKKGKLNNINPRKFQITVPANQPCQVIVSKTDAGVKLELIDNTGNSVIKTSKAVISTRREQIITLLVDSVASNRDLTLILTANTVPASFRVEVGDPIPPHPRPLPPILPFFEFYYNAPQGGSDFHHDLGHVKNNSPVYVEPANSNSVHITLTDADGSYKGSIYSIHGANVTGTCWGNASNLSVNVENQDIGDATGRVWSP